MSADSQSTIRHTPPCIRVSEALSEHPLESLLASLQANMTADSVRTDTQPAMVNLTHFVDGRGLACPMPLLKTKVALREVSTGDSLYVVATDGNSDTDITAFCRQSQQASTKPHWQLSISEVTHERADDDRPSQPLDTIHHFIITKTDSN